jgi:hypothetical protein
MDILQIYLHTFTRAVNKEFIKQLVVYYGSAIHYLELECHLSFVACLCHVSCYQPLDQTIVFFFTKTYATGECVISYHTNFMSKVTGIINISNLLTTAPDFRIMHVAMCYFHFISLHYCLICIVQEKLRYSFPCT